MATLLEILQTRVEIVATEFEEERVRLRELVVFGSLTLFFVSVGLTLATLFVVALYWDTHRLAVLGGVALLYLGLGGFTAICLNRRLKSRPRLFYDPVRAGEGPGSAQSPAMNAQLTAITRRRAALVAQAAAQRSELGLWVQPWQKSLAFVDQGIALARRVRAHPLALAIGTLLLFRLVAGRWGVWAERLWTGWQIYQSLHDRQSRPRD